MEVIKEGTHTYLLRKIKYKESVCDEADGNIGAEPWDYYLSVEYEVLKRNRLKTFIPVQLREKDGEKSLLFDVTGKCPLKRQGKESAFSKKKCEKILQSMINIMQEIDDYMLDLNCIELRPEYIYEEGEGEIQWIYFPQISSESEIQWNLKDGENKNEDLQKRIESLFAWMLTQIDYEDTDAVQFMYRFYNKVRKRGFSKELLETYIRSETQKEYDSAEEEEANTDEKIKYSGKIKPDRMGINKSIPYEDFFREEIESEQGKKEDSQNKNNVLVLYTALKIISILGALSAVCLEGIFIFYGIKRGFIKPLFQYSIGGMLLIIVFIYGFVWSTRKVRKIKQNRGPNSREREISNKKGNIKKENKVRYRKKREQEESLLREIVWEDELQVRPQMIKTEVDWEEETEGTTVLNCDSATEESKRMCCPMLRDIELGIVYIIKSCPFYIGSAEGVNHLQIQDKTVSREHAVILEDMYKGEEQGYILRDMDSTNGTWINGKKIKKGRQGQLEEGAVIRFAKKEYEFLLQDIS